MKKLNRFALYALVTPALTLSAGTVLAQDTGYLNDDSAWQTTVVYKDAIAMVNNDRQRNQRDQARTQMRSYLDSLPANGMHASNLMGTDVHTSDNDNIGSVDDLILDQDGQVVAVIVSVGGFLGVGQKNVAIGWDNLTRSGAADDQSLRADVTRNDLTNAPEFIEREQSIAATSNMRDHGNQQRVQQDASKGKPPNARQRTQQAAAPSARDSATQTDRNRQNTKARSGAQHRGHIDSAPANGSHAKNVIGMDVYTIDNEDIGSVDDLLIDQNGQVVAIVVSVGGFLGIGQKDVAISWDDVTRSGTGDEQQLQANVTRDALSTAPEFANRN